jgi:nicotinamidase-related amidase
MLIEASRSQLLVIDLQERLLPAIHEAERVLDRTRILLRAAGALGVPVTVTEQYPKGLGPTVQAVRDALPAASEILDKMTFSAAGDEGVAALIDGRRDEGRDQLVILGTEAHVCVLQTALAFRGLGYEVFVVEDAVSSRAPASVRAATARMLHAGCGWVTSEMVVFEWLERAGTDAFRSVMPLIR